MNDLGTLIRKLVRHATPTIATIAILSSGSAYGQFGIPKNVIELNSSNGDAHAVVSQDNLQCFFATDNPPSQGGLDIWYAERNIVTDPFTVIGPVANINTSNSDRPSFLSQDKLILHKSDPSIGDWNMYVAVRPNLSSPFRAYPTSFK